MPKTRFDIIHIQGADSPVGNILTAHCCNAAMSGAASVDASRVRRWNYGIGAAAEHRCFSSPAVRKVIAVSEQVKRDIERHYGISPQNVAVVPHGVDAETFHPRNRARLGEPLRRELGIGVDDFVLVFVGGDYRLKGLPVLVAAVRKARLGVTVLTVGVEAHKLPLHLRELDPRAGRLLCVGAVSDVAPYYAAADCFVLPTRYDTFSLSTLEAMASGLPVIVSRAAGISEQLTHGGDALLLDDPADVDALASHLQALSHDAEQRARLGKHARALAERLTWEEVADRTVALYREVAELHA